MIDAITPLVVLLIVLAVLLRRTSAGVAVIALLAGVMLDQLLSAWIIAAIPAQSGAVQLYVEVVVHLLVTFAPMGVALGMVRTTRKSVVLSLLTSLLLGFLVVYFGLKILAPIPALTKQVNNAGLVTFLNPYQNYILSIAAILAIIAMALDHRKAVDKKDK